MQEASAGRRIVLTSLPLTALFTAAVLFFGLRYAESEPLVFPAAALILIISAVITGKLLKAGSPVPDSPYIIRSSDTPAPDSLADCITYYFSDAAEIKSYALILRQTDAGIRAAEAFISYDIILTPDTLTETPKDVQISQLGRLYRQKPLIFSYTAEQIHADSQL